jgi:hypothetical protein
LRHLGHVQGFKALSSSSVRSINTRQWALLNKAPRSRHLIRSIFPLMYIIKEGEIMPSWKELLEQLAVIQAALVPFVILTMRALIVMSLCTAMVAESAFAKQRFNPTKCSQTAYSACLHDAGPFCRKDAASEPAATRAVEHTACLARYQSTCREIHCD